MPTRHVICCDGTWNKPDTVEDDIDDNTNVVKFRDRVVEGAVSDEWTQVVKYIVGVGAQEKQQPDSGLVAKLREKLGARTDKVIAGVEGATGFGVSERLLQGYRYLCHNYKAGDQIYIVGFSRGGFTACSLAGMVGRMELVKDISASEATVLYGLYLEHKHDQSRLRELRQHAFAGRELAAPVHFLGVWDVVGSLGFAGGLGHLLQKVWGVDPTNTLERLHDTEIHPRIRNAYHALALHEYREDFKPTLWESPPAMGQQVQQAWFAGAHSNVGGGYDQKLSAIPLAWIMTRAQACGLKFKEGSIPDVDKNLNDYLAEDAADSYKDFMAKFDIAGFVKDAIDKEAEHLLPDWAKDLAGKTKNLLKEGLGGALDGLGLPPKPHAPDLTKEFPRYYRPLGGLTNGTEFMHPSVNAWLATVSKLKRTLDPESRTTKPLKELPPEA